MLSNKSPEKSKLNTTKKSKPKKLSVSQEEEGKVSLRKKRSKSVFDIAEHSNLTSLYLDSECRTLGPEQIRLLWEENNFWRGEWQTWKKLSQTLYSHFSRISGMSNLPPEVEAILTSANIKMTEKPKHLTLGLHMKKWKLRSKWKRKEPLEFVLLENPSKDKKNKAKKVQATEIMKSLNQFFGQEESVEFLIDRLPYIEITTGIAGSAYADIFGPDPSGSEEQQYQMYKDSKNGVVASGFCISTYPEITIPGSDGQKERIGTPNCDIYRCRIYKNRLIACVTDGCGWGSRSKKASTIANKTFVDYIEKQISNATDIQAASLILLKALQEAHERIIEGISESWDAGATTLCGGILLQVPPQDTFDAPFAFLLANIGDCKAYHCTKFNQENDDTIERLNNSVSESSTEEMPKKSWSIVDITSGNRDSDVKLAGGHLGPKSNSESGQLLPDLSNFSLHLTPCQRGDIIVIMTDGVHDNLDPEAIGVEPTGIGLNYEKWSDLPADDRITLKDSYRTQLLNRFFRSVNNLDPKEITNWGIKWVKSVTDKKREYMENNLDDEEPSDHKLYPGKMDHSTLLSFVVQ